MTSIEAIINRQLLKWELEKKQAEETKEVRPEPNPIVTISRQTGSRGSYFGSRLAQKLGYQRLHHEAIDIICRSSGYRRRVIESLDEHFRGNMDLAMESIMTGQSVDHSDYARHLCQMVLSMSQLGGVVVMGRGGSFILGPMRGFHSRIVCPFKKRVENLMKYKQFPYEEAEQVIAVSDRERRQFIKKLFNVDNNDPHYYDMVLNTALIDIEDLVETTAIAIKAKVNKLTFLDHDEI